MRSSHPKQLAASSKCKTSAASEMPAPWKIRRAFSSGGSQDGVAVKKVLGEAGLNKFDKCDDCHHAPTAYCPLERCYLCSKNVCDVCKYLSHEC